MLDISCVYILQAACTYVYKNKGQTALLTDEVVGILNSN